LVKTPIVSTRFGPRTVVIDEFPGDDYGTERGEAAPQVATWLATTTVDDVEDLTSLQQEATTLAEAGDASGSLVEGVKYWRGTLTPSTWAISPAFSTLTGRLR